MGDVSQQQQASSSSSSSSSQPVEMSGVSDGGHPVVVVVDEFLSTGRTGRRNAMADILDENGAYITTADLPDQLQSLSFGSDPSASSCMGPSTSKAHSSASPS